MQDPSVSEACECPSLARQRLQASKFARIRRLPSNSQPGGGAGISVREAAGRSAKQRIEAGYLWPKIAQQIEQVYLEMMGWKPEDRSDSTESPTIVTSRGSAA